MKIPNCDPADTILQTDLDRVKGQDAVLKIKFIYTDEGSYLMFVLKSDPSHELYLVTRRDRTRPKVFVDQNVLLASLYREFPDLTAGLHQNLPGLIFEASAEATPADPDPASD